MLPRAICGEWSLNLNSGFVFLGAPQKTQQPPWLLLAGSTAHFYSRHRTRVSLFLFPPSLPCLIALGIAFARCCIRRWPCLYVCILYLASPPALRGLLGLFPIGINQSDPRGAAGFIAIYTPATPIRKNTTGGTSVF